MAHDEHILSIFCLLPVSAIDETRVDEGVRSNVHAETLSCSRFRLKANKVQGQERANIIISTQCSDGESHVSRGGLSLCYDLEPIDKDNSDPV